MPSTVPTLKAAIWQAARLGLVVVAVDQLTKLAATRVAAGHTGGLLVPVRNPRFSLGLAGASLPVMALLMAVGIAAGGGYALRAVSRGRLAVWIPGLLVGGASSNLTDRLLLGSVRDFLATPWAVVNLADLAVVAAVIGVAITRPTRRPRAGGAPREELGHEPCRALDATSMPPASSHAVHVTNTARPKGDRHVPRRYPLGRPGRPGRHVRPPLPAQLAVRRAADDQAPPPPPRLR
jgi:lipoprotein signal peptidase